MRVSRWTESNGYVRTCLVVGLLAIPCIRGCIGFVRGVCLDWLLATVYCTPANLRDPSMLPDKYLLWTNADGSLRKRHVLGTDIDTLVLVNANGIEVSSAHIPDSGIVEPLHTARHRAMNSFIRRTNMYVRKADLIEVVLCARLESSIRHFLLVAVGLGIAGLWGT